MIHGTNNRTPSNIRASQVPESGQALMAPVEDPSMNRQLVVYFFLACFAQWDKILTCNPETSGFYYLAVLCRMEQIVAGQSDRFRFPGRPDTYPSGDPASFSTCTENVGNDGGLGMESRIWSNCETHTGALDGITDQTFVVTLCRSCMCVETTFVAGLCSCNGMLVLIVQIFWSSPPAHLSLPNARSSQKFRILVIKRDLVWGRAVGWAPGFYPKVDVWWCCFFRFPATFKFPCWWTLLWRLREIR